LLKFALRPLGPKTRLASPGELLHIEKFDMKKRILTMHFSNKNNPDLPGSFSLSVKETMAVLSINGKEIKSDFNWDI
jgi:hypothetical protein